MVQTPGELGSTGIEVSECAQQESSDTVNSTSGAQFEPDATPKRQSMC